MVLRSVRGAEAAGHAHPPLRGARAWHTKRVPEARVAWRAVLARPAKERRYRFKVMQMMYMGLEYEEWRLKEIDQLGDDLCDLTQQVAQLGLKASVVSKRLPKYDRQDAKGCSIM